MKFIYLDTNGFEFCHGIFEELEIFKKILKFGLGFRLGPAGMHPWHWTSMEATLLPPALLSIEEGLAVEAVFRLEIPT